MAATKSTSKSEEMADRLHMAAALQRANKLDIRKLSGSGQALATMVEAAQAMERINLNKSVAFAGGEGGSGARTDGGRDSMAGAPNALLSAVRGRGLSFAQPTVADGSPDKGGGGGSKLGDKLRLIKRKVAVSQMLKPNENKVNNWEKTLQSLTEVRRYTAVTPPLRRRYN